MKRVRKHLRSLHFIRKEDENMVAMLFRDDEEYFHLVAMNKKTKSLVTFPAGTFEQGLDLINELFNKGDE